ncbi:hypothetical protein RUND412_001487 [Rhizina undulata]
MSQKATQKRKRRHAAPTPELIAIMELLNDLDNFCGVGSLDLLMPRRAMPGPDAPDGWHWLEPVAKEFVRGPVESALQKLVVLGVIRCTYRMITADTARVRIYVLPSDVGRGIIGRKDPAAVKKCVRTLVEEVDVSVAGWEGRKRKCGKKPVAEQEDDRSSLFYMFNTLQSPKPDPASPWIRDENVKFLLKKVLNGKTIPGLKTKLYEYQRRSVAMMLQRELAPERVPDSRLRELRAPTGEIYYLDLELMEFFSEPKYYDDVRGGILSEEMGTGKTLICLAVILSSKHQTSAIPEEHSLLSSPRHPQVPTLLSLCVSSIWRNNVPWTAYESHLGDRCITAIASHRGYFEIEPPCATRSKRFARLPEKQKVYQSTGTIIVCPPNLVEQWRSEIAKHVEEGMLKVLFLAHSNAIIPPVSELLKYDLVIFSRTRFDQEDREGKDSLGRREFGGVPLQCSCPYIGASRTRDCNCFRKDAVYRSPLRFIQWKRLIVDEGHSMASMSVKSCGVCVAEKLPVERRWIVSGTPSSGLLGVMVGMMGESNTDLKERREKALAERKESRTVENQDLDRLGRIVRDFLKLQPWATTEDRGESASWNAYITKGFVDRRPGSTTCVRNILQRLMVRHRQEDIEEDVVLPPLHHKVVLIKPGYFETLSMNLFVASLASNAVTSERTDQDYMFHPSQRGQLRLLVNNLLKRGGFFWTGFSKEDVQSMVRISRNYLTKVDKRYSAEDRGLLQKSAEAGEHAIMCPMWNQFSLWDEMGYFITNFPASAAQHWTLSPPAPESCPPSLTLLGGTQVLEVQKLINTHLYEEDPSWRLKPYGTSFIKRYKFDRELSQSKRSRTNKQDPQSQRGVSNSSLAADRKAHYSPITGTGKILESIENGIDVPPPKNSLKSILKSSTITPKLPENSPLKKTEITATASSKLNYLISQILYYHTTSKILIFYESEDVAWYIAQALEILSIEYLAYQKDLPGQQKARYIVTFQHSPKFRVLLMDLTQAAHGLNVTSADRVFFVNPVWDMRVEAQALKRAHRIGQEREVWVETLVLEGTIEAEVVKRRSAEKKEVLDAGGLKEFIQRMEFLPWKEYTPQNEFDIRLWGGREHVHNMGEILGEEKSGERAGEREDSPVESDLVHIVPRKAGYRRVRRSTAVATAPGTPSLSLSGSASPNLNAGEGKVKRRVGFRDGGAEGQDGAGEGSEGNRRKAVRFA